MANSNTRRSARKPTSDDKPNWRIAWGLHLDYPLFPHKNGRWAKKVRGKFSYFGKIADDPKGAKALDLWNEQKDDLLAGRKPRTKTAGVTVAELCDHFIQAKDDLLATGEITRQTRIDYYRTTTRIIDKFGKTRTVADLTPDDFQALRSSLAKTLGHVALGNEIQRVRVVFKHGYDSGMIDQPMRYGPLFKRPSKKALRIDRAEKGERMLEAAAVVRLIEAADVQMRAMIYLAVNCGFGNSDCGTLPLASLDLAGGWLDYHRPKTGIDRRCPLWPETVAALQAASAKRPAPKLAEAELLVFVTKYGAPWAKDTFDNPVTKEFRKLLDGLDLYRAGLGFYTLRHVFRTIADGSRDQPAINSIMGHADASMAAAYRERIDDSRLRAVADHVRAWLFPEVVKKEREAAAAAAKAAAKPKAERKPRREKSSGDARPQAAAEGFQLRIVG